MLFEPYYALSLEKDNKGNERPSKKYKALQNPITGYKKVEGDKFLEEFFLKEFFYNKGYIKRLRKCYDKVMRELSEVLKNFIIGLSIFVSITITVLITAGMFAPSIAVALVGSNFVGLNGIALTNACLAFLGGGAIAAGGAGIAGGTMVIVGGGGMLGLIAGAGVGGAVGVAGIMGAKQTIVQSAKLMVSIKEIFLKDEHDVEYSNTVYEQYLQNIIKVEKDLVELKLQKNIINKKEKEKMKLKIKNAEESIKVMKTSMKIMSKYLKNK